MCVLCCAVLRGVGVLCIAWACILFSCWLVVGLSAMGGLVAGGVKMVLLGGYTRTSFPLFTFTVMLFSALDGLLYGSCVFLSIWSVVLFSFLLG
jgi:hypothetical protein